MLIVREEMLDCAWRLGAYGAQYTRAWHKYPAEGAANEIVALAWRRAIKLGYEVACPFDGLLSTTTSKACPGRRLDDACNNRRLQRNGN